MDKIKVGIIGATGFTGSELVRVLTHHPDVEIAFITSESRAGERFSDVHPFFEGLVDQELIKATEIRHYDPELVFLALPHGVSMEYVRDLSNEDFKIIDLSGDFRLDNAQMYEEWYGQKHSYPAGIGEAIFGCPEILGSAITKARLVANPGCYPTSAILALAPLIKSESILTKPIIVDSKSGITGAGIKSKAVNLYSNVNDNFKAYGLKKHRHTIEIQSVLERLLRQEIVVQFTPHLLPVDRGILTTVYAQPRPDLVMSDDKLREIYTEFYKDAPFVRIRKQPPAIKDVRGSNYCDIYPTWDERTGMIILISVIDNLVKGAAGQAVQNMNLMLSLDETSGLMQLPLNP